MSLNDFFFFYFHKADLFKDDIILMLCNSNTFKKLTSSSSPWLNCLPNVMTVGYCPSSIKRSPYFAHYNSPWWKFHGGKEDSRSLRETLSSHGGDRLLHRGRSIPLAAPMARVSARVRAGRLSCSRPQSSLPRQGRAPHPSPPDFLAGHEQPPQRCRSPTVLCRIRCPRCRNRRLEGRLLLRE